MNRTHTHRNLYPTEIAKAVGKANEEHILKFLANEKYTTSLLIQLLLNMKFKSSARSILSRMAGKGLIKKHIASPTITVWGITHKGLSQINPLYETTNQRPFEASKFNPHTLGYINIEQQLHIACLKRDIKFTVGKQLDLPPMHIGKAPDAAIKTNNVVAAIEIDVCNERKMRKRYAEMMYQRLVQIQQKKINHVLFVSGTPEDCRIIRKIIHSVDVFKGCIGGRKTSLRFNDAHLSYFKFIHLGELDHYLKTRLSA